RDNVIDATKPYFTRDTVQRQVERDLRRFERRGTTARNRVERELKKTRTRVERELRQRRNRVQRVVRRNRTRVEREVRRNRRRVATSARASPRPRTRRSRPARSAARTGRGRWGATGSVPPRRRGSARARRGRRSRACGRRP